MSAVIPDREVLAASPAEVGGKGWQLAQLRQFGLPVPEFLVLAAAGVVVTEAELALAWEAVIERGWAALPLAVRSSAVGEDGGQASFAGIYRSCLNVQGPAQFADAVRAVRASLVSPTALAYRQCLGLTAEPAMAVVVMPLLPAVAAGIAFSGDPRTGRDDRLLIHAQWGLGEALVGGEAAGDEYELAEDSSDTWRVLRRTLGSKAVQRVCAVAGGTVSQPVPSALATQAVLSEAAAEQLAALVRDAAYALDFVTPFYDLEWLWDGRRFWLTQARPVTRRPHHTYPALHGQPAIWTRGNTCELLPEPMAPADWNFSRRGVNALLEQGWGAAGYALLPGVQRAGLFHGRLYLEAAIMQWEAWDAVGLPPHSLNRLLGGHHPAITVPPANWRQRWRWALAMLRYLRRAGAIRRRGEAAISRLRALARQIRQAPLPGDAAALRAAVSPVLRASRQEVDMFFLQGSGGGSLSMLMELLEKRFPGEGEALGSALLAGGEPSVTAQQGYALLDLAKLAREQGQASAAFATAWAAFLDEYGHRGHYETYFRSQSWREQPAALLAQLEALAAVDAESLRRRQREVAAAAWQRIAEATPGWRWPALRFWLKGLVRAANRECNQREAARSALMSNLDALRHLGTAAIRLLRESSALAADQGREALQFLLPWEIDGALAGDIPAAGIRARVAARQAQFARWSAEEAPEYLLLGADGQHLPALTGVTASPVAATPAPGGTVWRGGATGTGVVQGRVRRLFHPAEGDTLLPGEILVAPSTDPGWTPLFLKAGGLVVATGGFLSHGAIVAREFALPAVVNLPGILTALQDGELIEVDGGRGTVRRLG